MSDADVPSDGSTTENATEGHGGDFAVAVAQTHGVQTLFTLSGAHVFPMYDGAVRADPPMRILDVRHEATAVFAAEATGKLTRVPGLAVLTAGPGVTNGVSAIAQARFSGSPLVVIGGRAPTTRWGMGSLQELDHPPLVAPITKLAATVATVDAIPAMVDSAFTMAAAPHRGPVFLDVPMDQLFSRATLTAPAAPRRLRLEPDPDALSGIAELLRAARHPVLVLGKDVWADGAEVAALRFVEETGIPVVTNGMGRGIVPRGHPQFSGKAPGARAQVVHLTDSPDLVARHVTLEGSAAGDLSLVLDGLLSAVQAMTTRPDWTHWIETLRTEVAAAAARDTVCMASDADPIHPARVYGELLPRLADDSVVIGDGGDFVSFAGKYVEPARPGGWLDPGPYGCLGAGLGAAIAARIARPSSQVVVLLGDGAAGMSLMDVDTLVRHDLPVVLVLGNNSGWGLEKHPMRFLYGYDVAAELAPGTAYDGVVRALGGAGETVSDPSRIGEALDRAFDSGVPYLVNMLTDPETAYPRSTTGV
ncbi:MAG: thiamine pyrophosphate-dependent enzyme [Nocardioidaceae bacterium]